MTLKEAIKYFGTAYKMAKACDISQTSVYLWKIKGYIPIKRQYLIEAISGGSLKADYAHCIDKKKEK